MSINSSLDDHTVEPISISREVDPLITGSNNIFSDPTRYDSSGDEDDDANRFDATGSLYSPYSTTPKKKSKPKQSVKKTLMLDEDFEDEPGGDGEK